MTALLVRGYWCPACHFAFRTHTDEELVACAEALERREGDTKS